MLDADDSFITDSFAHLLQTLRSLDVDLVISDALIHDMKGNAVVVLSYQFPVRQIVSFDSICSKDAAHGMYMHVITYRRDLLTSMNYKQTEGICYTDCEWAFIPMLNVKTIYYFNEQVYSYLKGRPGQTMDPIEKEKTKFII